MFRATITYRKNGGLTFSNPESTFVSLFNVQSLEYLLAAFDKDHVEVRGEVLPEDPIRFVVDGIRFDDFDFEVNYVKALTRYLKLDFTPKIEIMPQAPNIQVDSNF